MIILGDDILHASWWVVVLVGIGGIGLFWTGRQRADKTLLRVAVGVILAAAVLAGIRLIFPTARERMEARSRKLVKAADAKDWNAFASLLDANTSVGTLNHPIASGREKIRAMAQADCESYGVSSVSVLSIDSQQTQTLITVGMQVVSRQTATDDQPITSSWQFDYQQSGNRWLLEKVTMLGVGDQNVDRIIPLLK